MSDIWCMDSDGGVSVGKEEDWACSSSGSDAEGEQQRPRKRAKKASKKETMDAKIARLFAKSREEPAAAPDADSDDFLAAFLTTTPGDAANGNKKVKGTRRSPTPLLGLDDDDLLAAQAAAAAVQAANAQPDAIQLAAQQQRALYERLAKAQAAAHEDDDDYDDIEVLESEEEAPPPPPGQDLTAEDPFGLLEELAASQPDAAGSSGVHKVPLVFQAQGHDKVTVRVQPSQPLSRAMEAFSSYAAEQGWGRAVKFMFDGEKLSGEDSAQDLDMEAEDVVDVYLDS